MIGLGKKENKNLQKKMRLGKTQQKILTLLLGGVALGFSGNPKKFFEILGEIDDSLKEIDKQSLKRAIKKLYESNLIDEFNNNDGTKTLILTENGEKKALTFDLKNIKIKIPKKWDGKWRIILFDVPEKRKVTREILRSHFKNIGLYEYQKSVFVCPYDCKDEIEYIIELNNAKEFVRFIIAEYIDNELHIKTIFNIRE
ncbi:hypothetical protein A3I18_01270 [Candidatus Campbellbacteria bacterium RIFCSPLOWO2_02_FULL_35_11]|uniref:Transcriptional repressor PaaX-like central Cas2-like domain-containing protein n=1 Tax=Candidatus Campbellbacteria bacterium RIFCSPLOWO2_02_FULL_35_11 TaxID=1797581 RepID=A0A1F5ERS9_9BACT|nr:MAG: hypothetical protein A3I18_01270 [Candidatus Campbellbacteria bacterium RIFCSPLOWO2_02_FULL_35_11]